MAWEVPQFSTSGANQAQAIQQVEQGLHNRSSPGGGFSTLALLASASA